ncbi:DNA helicase UvrD [Candidatus Falkowbacteria bacterium CG10_big_fil_rev_8_21_14_0_10_43_10]|uniref:DNA helicase UvrD n=1 Tax=Candidatus Falkowbacteria bacterium CG10_big_fil_rev_8_21_14_0_10_43_10 TaxID=1974567 RepID=A0A2H0V3Q7_9BACT|nr:MAG: DNA helicase UvrD [Candidatus Falkowbacteria bacterium CG10_big_fil_rev_8_21_14_0_10_43_10]
MRQILDLHIHSRYSRACSKDLTLENLDKACRVKGVDIIATGDFTHPAWFDAINDLTPSPSPYKGEGSFGLYQLKNSDGKIKFILSTEVALIYKQGEGPGHKGGASHARRLHIVVLAPNIAAVKKLNKYLDAHYNIRSDGRPILGMSAVELCKILFDIDEKFMVIPAHIWTPWFSIFGSKSGFNSVEECFGEFTKYIYAYETGLSSDPEMNWRVSELDNFTLLSNSDAHSLPNIAREANVFEMKEISYDAVYDIIRLNSPFKRTRGEKSKFGELLYTIEFYPEEGMYHYDGHRACNVRLSPAETKKQKGICPVCKKPLTIGVCYRVDELADRELGFKPKHAAGYKKLVELDKIIAESLDIRSRSSQKVQIEYNKIIQKCGPELSVLIDAPLEKIAEYALPEIVEGIKRTREERLIIEPGFDGQYGTIKIFNEKEKANNKQVKLF